ncbi:MAG: hypothetical protein ACLS5W_04030 [Coprococcus sp.]
METIPRNDFDMRNRYDAFCKAVLRNEAKNYLSEMARHRDREKSLEALTQQELDKLSTVDHYPSDSYVFRRMDMTCGSTTSLWPRLSPVCRNRNKAF